jgi:hypothetical protein
MPTPEHSPTASAVAMKGTVNDGAFRAIQGARNV